ncbi:hypothetical protein [Streptomyces sp. NPDC020681]
MSYDRARAALGIALYMLRRGDVVDRTKTKQQIEAATFALGRSDRWEHV